MVNYERFATALESMMIPAMEAVSVPNYKTIEEGMQAWANNKSSKCKFRVNDNYNVSVASSVLSAVDVDKIIKGLEISLKLLPESKKKIAEKYMTAYKNKTNKDISESDFIKELNLESIEMITHVHKDSSIGYDIEFKIGDGGLFGKPYKTFDVKVVESGKKANPMTIDYEGNI